jgi:hypothetical protein
VTHIHSCALCFVPILVPDLHPAQPSEIPVEVVDWTVYCGLLYTTRPLAGCPGPRTGQWARLKPNAAAANETIRSFPGSIYCTYQNLPVLLILSTLPGPHLWRRPWVDVAQLPLHPLTSAAPASFRQPPASVSSSIYYDYAHLTPSNFPTFRPSLHSPCFCECGLPVASRSESILTGM